MLGIVVGKEKEQMYKILKLKYDVEQMQKGLLNKNTNKENKLKLWKSMTKKNHMLHLELFREIQNGQRNKI